jgi:hypothetical protein
MYEMLVYFHDASASPERQQKEHVMPILVLSQDEWQAYFPHPPQPSTESRFASVSARDLQTARFAAVSIAITVDTIWPGLGALDDQNRIGAVHFSLGRWFIDDTAISRIDDRGGEYDIELDRLTETDWVAHMLGKAWFYDPTDFFDILEEARRLRFPSRSPEWLDDLLWREIREILATGERPFFPSRVQDRNRIYLVNRMGEAERDAFCLFLAQQGYAFD